MREYLLHINGEWVGENLEKMEVVNPANGEVVGTVPRGGETETEAAIEAAYSAFQSWSKLTAYERSAYLKKLYELMLENQEELAESWRWKWGNRLKNPAGEFSTAQHSLNCMRKEEKRYTGKRFRTKRKKNGSK